MERESEVVTLPTNLLKPSIGSPVHIFRGLECGEGNMSEMTHFMEERAPIKKRKNNSNKKTLFLSCKFTSYHYLSFQER